MNVIRKQYIVNEKNQKVAVQIHLKTFEHIEEILENYGLAKLMEEVEDDERLSGEEAMRYYKTLKNNVES
jgi:hypothetical protein